MATIATLSWDDDSDAPDNMSFVAADTPSARSEKAAERNAGASIPPQGPVLLALPAMKRNPDLVFDVFEELPPQRAGAASGSDRRKRRRIVVGETDRVQIGGRTADSGTIEPTYLVAVWDPDTGVATIAEAPAIRASRIVKSAAASSTSTPSGARVKNMEARNVLGEAFGTKKRQQQIRSYERNQVEMDTMGDVVNVVETMIDNRLAAAGAAVEELPEGTRPRCDPKAEKLENAYDLEDVFVPSDLADLDISDLLAVQPGDIQKTLESRRISSPSFCYSRLEKELNKAAKHRSKDRIRRLVYISLLLQTFATFSGPNKSYHTALLSGRLGGVSHSIAQSLLSRFALQKPGETDKPTFGCNAQLKDKLACYIIVACLSLENYEIDVSMLAKDMRQSQRKIADLAKFVGCKTVKMTAADAQKLGSIDGAQQGLKATLVVPLTFPVPSRGRK